MEHKPDIHLTSSPHRLSVKRALGVLLAATPIAVSAAFVVLGFTSAISSRRKEEEDNTQADLTHFDY